MSYQEQLKQITEQYERSMRELGNEIRERHVLPFCRRRNWTYAATGHGGFEFRNAEVEDGMYADDDPELRSVLNVLETEVPTYGTNLGQWVEDVDLDERDGV